MTPALAVSAYRSAGGRLVLAAPVDVGVLEPEKPCGCSVTTPAMRGLDGHGWSCAGCGWGVYP